MSQKDDKAKRQEKLANFAVNLGLIYNIFLSLAKTFFGIFGHSSALLADGINSTSDVVYYIVVKIFLRIANRPSDKDHPFGHKQMENIASIVVGAFIVTTAIAIAWQSIDSIFAIIHEGSPAPPESIFAIFVFYVACFTLITKIVIYFFTRYVGRLTLNPTIKALASDHLNDIYAALAVIVGIFFSERGFTWVDPLAGIIVSIFIMKTGINILRESADGLMDVAPSQHTIDLVNACAKNLPDRIIVESILSHRYGQYYSVNITLGVAGSISIYKGNAIADLFEKRLLERDSNLKYVFVHYHPSDRL